MSVGHSQMSSSSTLMEASSSAAVLLGFFIVQIPPQVLAHSFQRAGVSHKRSYLSTVAYTRASADNVIAGHLRLVATDASTDCALFNNLAGG
jgi:hypothetical protein